MIISFIFYVVRAVAKRMLSLFVAQVARRINARIAGTVGNRRSA